MNLSLYFKVIGYILGFVLIMVFGGIWLGNYFAVGIEDSLSEKVVVVDGAEEVDLQNMPEIEVQEVVRGLYVPWSIVFTAPNRMLVTERNGRLRQILLKEGEWELFEEPVHVFEEVVSGSEEGLMGLAIDPEYGVEKLIYVCLAYQKNGNLTVKVDKLMDNGDSISWVGTLIDNIPGARFHAGCRIKFGPDGKLYVSTGDALQKSSAQDLRSLAGKFLRINKDGSVPGDNPFDGSVVWSLGHRNSQGFDWHPVSDVMVSSEHGPSIIDGPAGGDEINIIGRGMNYGWPTVSHEKIDERFEGPVVLFTPAIAPASGVFYDGDLFPDFYGDFFVGLLVGEGILKVEFDEFGYEVQSYLKLPNVDVGRVRDIEVAPSGEIFFSSSNSDGRGKMRNGDDKIYKLTVKQ